MSQHRGTLAPGGGTVVRPLEAAGDAARVLRLLDGLEAASGAPRVDEAEHERLRRWAQEQWRTPSWEALEAGDGETVHGYLGLLIGEMVAADLALADTAPAATLDALLAALERRADELGAGRVEVWLRHVGQREVEAVERRGFEVRRRLGVLGRALDGLGPGPAGDGTVRVRGYRAGEDDEAVVAVLAAAYAETPEAGWDTERLAQRRRLSWFRAEDLLLAELDAPEGRAWVGGLHWLKRRDATTGEVYNLAVHPDAQGAGLGPLLLHAGLEHLARAGLEDVVLWVDLDNDRAVELYTSQGFATRWEDLQLARDLGDAR